MRYVRRSSLVALTLVQVCDSDFCCKSVCQNCGLHDYWVQSREKLREVRLEQRRAATKASLTQEAKGKKTSILREVRL